MKTEQSNHKTGPQKRESMGKDSIWKLMLRFSLPAIISMTVASSYNLVDAIFVGRLGYEALAAMSVTFPLSLSFIAIASGTMVGMTSLISRSMGAGDHEKADRTASNGITLSFLISGLIALICLPTLDRLLGLLGAEGAVLSLARSYMSVLIVFNIFSYLSMILANIIRADGNPIFSSVVSVSSAVLNIILDPIFIFGWGPVPSLGIQGAAIATVIAQAIGVMTYWIFMVSGHTAYKFKPGYFWLYPKIVAEIYRVGTASIVRSGAQFIVMGVINTTAVSFGVIPLAIVGVLVRAGRFIQMPILGLDQGIVPVMGYNYGAQKNSRVAEMVFKCALAGSGWACLCWVAIMAFPTQVMSIFSGEAQFLSEGSQAIRLYSLAYFTLGIRTVPGLLFQGIGRGLPATVLTLAQNIAFLLPAVLILSNIFGVTGLWVAFPVADLLALVLGQVWMNFELRRMGISFFWWRTRAGNKI